jgi:riboflavin kinase/FMN adenylyltransferase
MRIYTSLEQFIPPAGGVVLSIGNFDGVHRGHARLVEQAQVVAARLSASVVVMTFDPHPLAVLAPERAPAILTTNAERMELLARAGADGCILLRSEPELLAQRAEDFLARLVTHCHPRALVEGPDFNFGRGRGGSIATLEQHAVRWGYEVHIVPAVHCAELPTNPTISSSSIRQALRDGRMVEANAMLGRPYRVTGRVGRGAARGAKLGFPTTNLDAVGHLLPQHAVYAAVAQLPDGSLRMAAVNVGPQPTFEQTQPRVEAHLLDFTGDLHGQCIGLHFLARLREQERFASPAALIEQVRRDIAATGALAAQRSAVCAIPL